MRKLVKFLRKQDGAVSVEYAIIGAMLSILIVSGASSVGTTIQTMFFGPVQSALN